MKKIYNKIKDFVIDSWYGDAYDLFLLGLLGFMLLILIGLFLQYA